VMAADDSMTRRGELTDEISSQKARRACYENRAGLSHRRHGFRPSAKMPAGNASRC
jgi:hypothetical protein